MIIRMQRLTPALSSLFILLQTTSDTEPRTSMLSFRVKQSQLRWISGAPCHNAQRF